MASATTALVTSDHQRCRGHHFRLGDVADREVHPERPRLGWHGRECASAVVRKPAAPRHHVDGLRAPQLGFTEGHASDEDDNVGGTPSRRFPQCRTAEQAIRRMSEEAGDPGRHLVDALVSISPDRGRLADGPPANAAIPKDSAVDVPQLAAHCQPYCQPFRVGRTGQAFSDPF